MRTISKLFTFSWQFSLVVIATFMLCAAAGVGIGRETAWSQSFKLATTASGGQGVLNLASTNDVTFRNLTVTTNIALTSLTANLPLFSDTNASPHLVNKSIANALLSYGIQSGSGSTSADNTVTNTFGTPFGSAPVVIVQPLGTTLVLTNWVTVVTTNGFVLNLGATNAGFYYIAKGTP